MCQCFGRVSRTEELLRSDQQMGDGLFDLRELLLGLHGGQGQQRWLGMHSMGDAGAQCGGHAHILGGPSMGPLGRPYRGRRSLFGHGDSGYRRATME
jgi:hypothetical protein